MEIVDKDVDTDVDNWTINYLYSPFSFMFSSCGYAQ